MTIFSAAAGKRPLQRLRLIPRRAHPDVKLLVGGQDHWHCLRVNKFTDGGEPGVKPRKST